MPMSMNEVGLLVGNKYLIRTVTHYYTGHIIAMSETEIVMDQAAWIADTGRFHNTVRDGVLNEVEPFVDPVIINRNAIVDATIWRHDLPRDQK